MFIEMFILHKFSRSHVTSYGIISFVCGCIQQTVLYRTSTHIVLSIKCFKIQMSANKCLKYVITRELAKYQMTFSKTTEKGTGRGTTGTETTR